MSIESVTEQQFTAKVEAAHGVTLVDFTSTYCAPCKTLLPILAELDQEFAASHLTILKIDVDDSPHIASQLGIMGVPTVIVFKDGMPVEKLVGLRPKAAYRSVISR